eukprot:14882224-Heterocapsa_arctica.AAC.1
MRSPRRQQTASRKSGSLGQGGLSLRPKSRHCRHSWILPSLSRLLFPSVWRRQGQSMRASGGAMQMWWGARESQQRTRKQQQHPWR